MNDVSVKTAVQQLRMVLVDNPMLIEITRFRRKFTGGMNKRANSLVLLLTALCYAGILVMVTQGQGSIPPLAVVIFQTVLVTFLAPFIVYQSISGERERRSWELLLVAPLTHAQIVMGKFLAALTGMAWMMILFLPPIVISAVTSEKKDWFALSVGELVSVTYAAALLALTMLCSARTRRSFMALGAALGTVAVYLLAVPLMLAPLLSTQSELYGLANVLNPMIQLTRLMDTPQNGVPSGALLPAMPTAQMLIPAYLLFVIVFLVWATKTVTFADNDVKLIPKKKTDA